MHEVRAGGTRLKIPAAITARSVASERALGDGFGSPALGTQSRRPIAADRTPSIWVIGVFAVTSWHQQLASTVELFSHIGC
jgi:hypothetical protein